MSSPSIQKATVGDMTAFVLENEKIRTVILPDMGGRILSLIYKPTETEFAWRNPNVAIAKPKKEVEFEDLSGFFDCFPTAEACTFRGRNLPGGGEVSFDPWKVLKNERTRTSVKLKMEARCSIYPFTIRKQISLKKADAVVGLRYELQNLSDEKLEYHYTAHNTLQVSPYHRIVLPNEVSKLKLGYAISDRLGEMGDEVSWPAATDKNGRTVDISKLASPSDGFGENLYTPELKETWCAAINEARKEAIAFTWSNEPLSHLLIWINNGGWRDYYHVALEPSSGRPDNLEMAVNQWKEYATLRAQGKVAWSENILLATEVKHIEKIENNEIIQK